MLQLRPTESFPIQFQLGDPSDTNTYYVRAYVRNLTTDTLLSTIDLTDKGSQRFLGSWEVEADISGQGYYVSILVRIFTDSGYTTESRRYRTKEEICLVQERWNRVFGGSGGVNVDYKKVRKIIQEEIEKKELNVDLSPLVKAIQKTQKMIINDINFPETDLNPLAKLINLSNEDIKRKVGEIIIPGIPKTIDLSSSDLIAIKNVLKEYKELSDKTFKETVENIREMFVQAISKIENSIGKNTDKIDKKIKTAPFFSIVERPKEKPQRRKIHI